MSDDDIVRKAMAIVASRMRAKGVSLTDPSGARSYLVLKLASETIEHFGLLFLDNQLCLIKDHAVCTGTVDQCTVYPREVVRAALACDASMAICYHNHPSGTPEPSEADKILTKMLGQSLSAVGCRLLDHVIVARNKTMLFSEKGLL